MSKTLEKIQRLADVGDILISEHGYDELSNDNLTAREIVYGVKNAVLIEDYPDYPKGAAVLVLQKDSSGYPVHAVWGIPKGHDRPAVLVTAYYPDPQRWNDTFKERKR
ncbi:MAG: DUF4258 domain-containing protein [Desulfobacteraceae bacterium]|nr:DUF4258 domain-containing protein [Desulfobacteraceae bacterium]